MDYVFGIIVIAVIVIAAFAWTKYSNKKRLGEAWTGTVTKRWVATYTDEDGDTTKTPSLQIAIDGGKKKKLSVSQATYDAIKEGDKVKKEVGQKDPVKA